MIPAKKSLYKNIKWQFPVNHSLMMIIQTKVNG